MIRRLFARPPHPDDVQRTCSLDGCDAIATSCRLLVASQIGPCEVSLCEEHVAQLHQARAAWAKAADDIRQFQAEQAAKERDAQDTDNDE